MNTNELNKIGCIKIIHALLYMYIPDLVFTAKAYSIT